LTEDPTWIIDPLDGTTNFVARFPFIAVSIGFAVNKKVVVGLIYNPILEEMFTAVRGKGAFLNGEQIFISNTDNLKSALVSYACGYELTEEETAIFCKAMSRVIQGCRSWRRAGSAALDVAYTALGRLDLYCEKGVHAWDIAAGTLLVEEAGGIVCSISGGPLDICSRQVLVGNKILVAKFVSEILPH